MTRFYWMPLHVPDFFADAASLTAEERGALVCILCAVWRSPDGWLPDDSDDLARITGTGDRWPSVKKRLAPLLVLEGGRITHAATQAQRIKAAEIIRRRKAAAEARWRKANGRDHASAYANSMTDTDTDTDREERGHSWKRDTA